MLTKRMCSIALSLIVFSIFVLQPPASIVPRAHAADAPTVPIQYSWTDTFSEGLQARLNHAGNNTGIIDPAKAPQFFNSPTPSVPPAADPPSLFTNNFRVTGNYSLFPLENEPSITVTNQSGHVLMVVGANSGSDPRMPAYYSRDQGTTWIGPTFLPLARTNDTFTSDPGLAVNRTGTFYYSFMSIPCYYQCPGPNDLVVATSRDGGNWTNHIAVPRATIPRNSNVTLVLYDKPYLTVGPSPTNPLTDEVYVTYTYFVDFYTRIRTTGNYTIYRTVENSTIMEVHSADGVTWSAPRRVSPTVTDTFSYGNASDRLVQGSMPAVDPRNGALYVSYFDTMNGGPFNGNATIMMAKSTDGGGSFSSPVRAAFIPQQVTYSSSGCIGFPCYGGGFRWWSTMFPSMDVAQDGTVYISYGDRQSKTSFDPADIYLVASTDGGLTWSSPAKVNDDSSRNGAFFSWLKVSNDGVVHIIWGDRRMDPGQIGYDVFYAEATNHGSTIGTNTRVTDIGTDPNLLGYYYPFIGDYFNLAVSGNQVYPIWTDGRRAVRPFGQSLLQGETDIYMARIGPRDTPSITFNPSPPAGYQVPVTVSGKGLPREAFFAMKMNGLPIVSQRFTGYTYPIPVFFSDSSGSLTEPITPNANYYGAYPVELDEWLTGARVASGSLYIVDTRSLQVEVTSPPIAHPGDMFTWSVLLSPPSGSFDPQGITSTLNIDTAQLTYPNGTVQDLTGSMKPTGPTSFSLTLQLPSRSAVGIYTLSVEASQTGLIVQSKGSGTSAMEVDSRATVSTATCSPAQINFDQTTICLATVTDATAGSSSTPAGTIAWTTSGTGTFSSTTCTLTGTGSSASCWVSYMPTRSGSQVITASYGGNMVQPPASQPTTLVVTSPAQNVAAAPQSNTLLVGMLTGGAGAIGLAAGAGIGILFRRKPKPQAISTV